MRDDLDGDIRAAIASTRDTGGDDGGRSEGEDTPGAGAASQASEVGVGLAGDSPEAADAGGEAASPGSDASRAERARDASGRFAKGKAAVTPKPGGTAGASPASPGAVPPTATGAASLTPAPPAPAFKAPASWSGPAAEALAKAPPELQSYVEKREKDMSRFMNEQHAPVKRFAEQAQQALAPILPIAQARGVQPAQAIAQFAQFDRMLSHPGTRAQALAQLVQSYGGLDDAGVQILAQALNGAPAPQAQQQMALDPDTLLQKAEERVMQKLEARQRQHAATQAESEVQAFESDPKNVHMTDPRVRAYMSADIQAAAQQGQKLSLAEAYEGALWRIPEFRDTLLKQRADEQAKAQQASTQRARAAASSVRSQPAVPPSGPPADDLDSTIRAALNARRR